MNLAMFGDVVGRPGRMAIARAIAHIRKTQTIDAVIANVENAAHGFGVTPEILDELRDAGVKIFTSGNHIWKNHKGKIYLTNNPIDVLRPVNYPEDFPGRGWTEMIINGTRFRFVNLIGRVFMHDEKILASPYRTFDRIAKEWNDDAVTVVDFHAEATGEKRIMSWFLDGRATLLVGTHTHVQTADEQILPKGLGYISDLGMCGAVDSSLGMEKSLVYKKVIEENDISLEPPTHPKEVMAQGVCVTLDPIQRITTSINRIDLRFTL